MVRSEVQTPVNSAGIPMPPSKKRKLGSEQDLPAPSRSADKESVEDGDIEMEDAGPAEEDEWSTDNEEIMTDSGSEPDTGDEIAYAQRKEKSKKTAKRKFRATEPGQFGSTLEALLNTSVPGTSATPLALKPSVKRRKNEEKKEMMAKKTLEGEKREHEEVGRVTDVIGGWGGENERSLRKVAQRGVVQLFNVIQKVQAAKASEDSGKLALRGSGKPTLDAPKMHGRNKKTSLIPARKDDTIDKEDFMNAIRSGGVVSKV